MLSEELSKERVIKILDRAKGSPKGRLYIYESLKREIESLNLSSEDYQTAIIELARILHV